MTPREFEDWLVRLPSDEYDVVMQERISKLNPEQQAIMQAREVKRKERFRIIDGLKSANEDGNENIFNALRDSFSGEDFCEHQRSYVKNCIACDELEHLMFPELFVRDGLRNEDSE
jgi:hypothetical protein